MKINIKEWETGDWLEIWLNDIMIFEGHEVPIFFWVNLLRNSGYVVEETIMGSGEDD